VPVPDPEVEEKRQRILLKGEIPSQAHPPRGCNFSTRCPELMDRCKEEKPPYKEVSPGHWVACFLY